MQYRGYILVLDPLVSPRQVIIIDKSGIRVATSSLHSDVAEAFKEARNYVDALKRRRW